jgi:methyl-accepting chemotaxis protein
MKMPKTTLSGYALSAAIILTILGASFVVGCDQGINKYKPKVLEEARFWKSKIESDIQVAIDDIHKLISSLDAMKHKSFLSHEVVNNLIKETLENHPEYSAIWTCWEPNAFNNSNVKYQNATGHDGTGRYISYWSRLHGKIQVAPLNKNYANELSIYKNVIELGKEIVSDPIKFGDGDYKGFIVIYAVPITSDGKTAGAAGIGLDFLKFFKPIIRQVRVLDVAYGFLVNNNGVMVAHPTKWSNVGKNLEFFAFDSAVIQSVKSGQEASQIKISKTTGRKGYYQFVPIRIGNTENHWSLAISFMPYKLKMGREKW